MSEENTSQANPESTNASIPEPSQFKPWGMEKKQFLLFMHLGQFINFFVPPVGTVLPIVMWSQFKDQDADVDAHGKDVLNFFISFFIYTLFTCGLALLLQWIFGVIAAIKTYNGDEHSYPLTIKFIK